MSSLAATQADGYYKPEEKARTKQKASQFSRNGKVTFELMYKGKCLTCGKFTGKGTRFNASKKQVGMYYTSKIWEFRMGCKGCTTKFVIRTDPKTAEFLFVSGIKRCDVNAYNTETGESIHTEKNNAQVTTDIVTMSSNNQSRRNTTSGGSSSSSSSSNNSNGDGDSRRNYNNHSNNNLFGTNSSSNKNNIDDSEPDAMDRLERHQELVEQRKIEAEQFQVLKQQIDHDHGDNVTSNSRLRQAHRVVRHADEKLAKRGKELGIYGLLKSTTEDGIVARQETRKARALAKPMRRHLQKRKAGSNIAKQSIFAKKKKVASKSNHKKSSRSGSSSSLERALRQLPRGRMKYTAPTTKEHSSSILLRKKRG